MRPTGSEVHRLLSDNSLAKELTGWEPAVTLRAGLEATSRWIQARGEQIASYAV